MLLPEASGDLCQEGVGVHNLRARDGVCTSSKLDVDVP